MPSQKILIDTGSLVAIILMLMATLIEIGSRPHAYMQDLQRMLRECRTIDSPALS